MLASFAQKHRYNIRLAVKKGVQVRVCGQEMVHDFTQIMIETGMRDHFVTRNEAYFSNLLKNLGEHARLYMAFHEGTPIAGTLAIWFGDKVWYLYGASVQPAPEPDAQLPAPVEHDSMGPGEEVPDLRLPGVSGDLSEDNPCTACTNLKRASTGSLRSSSGRWT